MDFLHLDQNEVNPPYLTSLVLPDSVTKLRFPPLPCAWQLSQDESHFEGLLLYARIALDREMPADAL